MDAYLTPGLSLALLLLTPHLIPRAQLSPVGGIALWTAALLLRATLMVAVAVAVLLFVPQTQLFHMVAQWCLHTIVPLAESHLQIAGHTIADAAILIPALIIVFTVGVALFGAWRGALAVSGWLRRTAVGRRSDGSVIVGDAGMIVATTGLRRPEVVVSAGALLGLDDDELEAGLAHERGHVRRRHRFVTMLSLGLVGTARLLPGSGRAYLELHYHLERDADEYAVRSTGDPLALASAICKVAGAGLPAPPAVTRFSLAGVSGSCDRLGALTSRDSAHGPRAATMAAWALVSAMALAVAGVLVGVTGLGGADLGSAQALTGLTAPVPLCA